MFPFERGVTHCRVDLCSEKRPEQIGGWCRMRLSLCLRGGLVFLRYPDLVGKIRVFLCIECTTLNLIDISIARAIHYTSTEYFDLEFASICFSHSSAV